MVFYSWIQRVMRYLESNSKRVEQPQAKGEGRWIIETDLPALGRAVSSAGINRWLTSCSGDVEQEVMQTVTGVLTTFVWWLQVKQQVHIVFKSVLKQYYHECLYTETVCGRCNNLSHTLSVWQWEKLSPSPAYTALYFTKQTPSDQNVSITTLKLLNTRSSSEWQSFACF